MFSGNKKSIAEMFPLTDMQEKMYAAIQLGKCEYLVKITVKVDKKLDEHLLRSALEKMMDMQPALRTVFASSEKNGFVQLVLADYSVPFYTEQPSSNLSTGYEPWRLLWDEKAKVLELSYLHIVMDGWSMSIFWRLLMEGYTSFEQKGFWNPISAKSMKQIFISSATTQHHKQESYSVDLDSGKKTLLGERLHPVGRTVSDNYAVATISPELKKQLRVLCSKKHITQAVVYYAAWALLLCSITGDNQVTEGIVVSGREKLIGMENTIAMLIQNKPLTLRTDCGFEKMCAQIRDLIFTDDVPGTQENTVYDTLIAVENYPLSSVFSENSSFSIEKYSYKESPSFTFTLQICENEIILNTDKDKYAGNLSFLLDSFVYILEQLSNGCTKTEQLKLVKAEQMKENFGLFSKIPENLTLNRCIYNACTEFQTHIAISDKTENMSYQELLNKAQQGAAYLYSIGVRKSDVVAVRMPRSIQQLILVYAVILAGAVYLPIGISIPVQRVNVMMTQAKARYLITEENESEPSLSRFQVLHPNDFCKFVGKYVAVSTSPTDAAYILFTSGSSGTPKGCIISHQSIINRLIWNNRELNITEDTRQLFKTPVTFDVSIIEIFSLFFSGHTLFVLEEGAEKNPVRLLDEIRYNRITYIHFVPSMLNSLLLYAEEFDKLNSLSSLRLLVCSGEILPSLLAKKCLTLLSDTSVRLVNLYGPTEAAVDVSFHDCGLEHTIQTPIGRPIDNTGLFILSEYEQELPYGVEGELYISGLNLGIGYINDKQLTERYFITLKNGMRAYRTGDIAYRLSNGELVVIGRKDGQIKYNGVRIETDEIEYHLLHSGFVRQAKVMVYTQDNITFLTAFCCAEQENEVQIREYMQSVLPDVMLPSRYVFLNSLPTSIHGKSDNEKLIMIAAEMTPVEGDQKLKDEIEVELSNIWNKILRTKCTYCKNANFYSVGGSSLLLVKVLIAIRNKWNVVLEPSALYECPQLDKMAELIRKTLKEGNVQNLTVDTPLKPLSASVESIYYAQANHPDSTAYNMPVLIELAPECSLSDAQAAFLKVVNFYAFLHKRYNLADGHITESIKHQVMQRCETIHAEEDEVADLSYQFVKPFQMNSQLFRIVGIASPKKSWLFVDFHHILCDQKTIQFLLSAWSCALEGRQLPQGTVEDRVGYIRHLSDEPTMENDNHEKHFVLNEITPVFPQQTGKLKRFRHSLSLEEYHELLAICHKEKCSLFQFLFSAFMLFCAKAFCKDKLTLGTNIISDEVSGADMFGNMNLQVLSVTSDIKLCSDFRKLLTNNNQRLAESAMHPSGSVNKDFDVMFVREATLFHSPSLKRWIADVRFLNRNTKLPLTLFYYEDDNTLTFTWDYDAGMFEDAAVVNFSESFMFLLHQLKQNPNSMFSECQLLPQEMLQRLTLMSNGGQVNYGTDSLQEIFIRTCQKFPNSIAVYTDTEEITRQELLERCLSVAETIKSIVPHGEKIGILLNRRIDYLFSVMGAMLAGCPFIPLDADQPLRRNVKLLRTGEVKFCISDQLLDEITCLSPEEFGRCQRISWCKSKMVYSIFTSGSTGIPKECSVSHDNLKNYLHWANAFYGNGKPQCFAFFSSPAVDMTITSTLLPLIFPHSVVVYDGRPDAIIKAVTDKRVTIIKATPSHLALLTETHYNTTVKAFIIGGEQLTTTIASKLVTKIENEISIYNEYGPTEATVGCMIYQYKKTETFHAVPIGKAIPGMTVTIRDRYDNLCPIGVTGEIVIAGTGVISGYTNNPELSAERFSVSEDGMFQYRTGDIARMLDDGRILYEGRKDEQFKISGYRVELTEISTTAEQLDEIRHARAVVHDGHLILFCVPAAKNSVDELNLRKHLFEMLPGYMMPSRICFVKEIPIKSSGKTDYTELLTFITEKQKKDGEHKQSLDKIRDIILACWTEVLGHSDYTDEDGFMEAGGSSIKIAMLQNQIAAHFDFITVADLFCYPSVRTQTEYIHRRLNPMNLDFQHLESKNTHRKVAIVGVAFCLPDAKDIPSLRNRLATGEPCMVRLHGQRLDDEKRRLSHSGWKEGKYRFEQSPVIERIDLFDPAYFKIGKDEANAMLPAHRMLLCSVDDAFLDAGLSKAELGGQDCAVIIAMPTDVGFQHYLEESYPIYSKNAILNQVASGITGRIQHIYDLHGAAYMVDCACSSGLVAMHTAAKMIEHGECDMALTGSVNLLDPVDYFGKERSAVLSPIHHAFPFTEQAEGTSRGEGCICFVLEEYEKAIQSHRKIYAIIDGSAINNDGQSSSVTSPNGRMQEDVIERAWLCAGLKNTAPDIIESHGTATKLGDTIELQGILHTLCKTNARSCALSAVKGVYGHLDSASGLLGVLKSIVSIQYGEVYPLISSHEPLSGAEIIATSLYLPNKVISLSKQRGEKIYCGISSFGLSGTNVHMVISGVPNSVKLTEYNTRLNLIRCWLPEKAEVNGKKDERIVQVVEKQEHHSLIYEEVLDLILQKIDELYGDSQTGSNLTLLQIGFDSISVTQLKVFIQNSFEINLDISADDTPEQIAFKITSASVQDLLSDSIITTEKKTSPKHLEGNYTPKFKRNSFHFRNAVRAFLTAYRERTKVSFQSMLDKQLHWANGRFMTGYTAGLEQFSYPILAKNAKGSLLVDVDGNQYIDFAMGFGAIMFGYNHPYISQKVAESLDDGIVLGALMPQPFAIAQRICKITGVERVSFCNSGTEAVMNLVRIARAVRNCDTIVVFSGAFHGTYDPVYIQKNTWNDGIVPAPRSIGTPLHYLDDIIMLPYGERQSEEYIKEHASRIAAVLVEPVQSRHPDLRPVEFIREIRRITEENNVLLIFDEVITGFRSGLRGAQAYYGITADLVAYGKVVGGGFPIGIFGGKAKYLDLIDHRGSFVASEDKGKWVSTGGTFNGHPAAIAAVDASLDLLEAEGEQIYERINKMTEHIADSLNRFFVENNYTYKVEYFCSQFIFVNENDTALRLLQYLLIYNGIFVWEGGTCYVSSAHTWEQITQFIETVKQCVQEVESMFTAGNESDIYISECIEESDYGKIKQLIQKYNEISDISLLETSLQSVLGANIANHSRHLDCSSIKVKVEDVVSPELMEEAVIKVIQAHPHLRSGMSWRRLHQPIYITYHHAIPEYHSHSIEENVEEIIEKRKKQGFILEQAPLLSFDSFHDESKTILVMTFYNSWIDGWSVDLLLSEIMKNLKGDTIQQEQIDIRSRYLSWCQENKSKSELFWKRYPLKITPISAPAKAVGEWYQCSFPIDSELEEAVRNYGLQHSITIAPVYLYCIAKAMHMNSIMTSFSGRNTNVLGITQAIGHYVSVMPINANSPEQLNEDIKHIDSIPPCSIQEIARYTKIDYETMVRMMENNTVVILNQKSAGIEKMVTIEEDKSFVFVPRRMYIKPGCELFITANEAVFSKQEAMQLANEFFDELRHIKEALD